MKTFKEIQDIANSHIKDDIEIVSVEFVGLYDKKMLFFYPKKCREGHGRASFYALITKSGSWERITDLYLLHKVELFHIRMLRNKGLID